MIPTKLLIFLIENNLVNNIPKEIVLELDSIDMLEDSSISEMLKEREIKEIILTDLTGVTKDKLEKLHCDYRIKHDSLSDKYGVQDICDIIEVIETIKQSIPDNATDLEKFMTIYKSIGMSADYDRAGCMENEKFTSYMGSLTRSLKGVLIDGRAVCAGYSVALKYALQYVGIETKFIEGDAHVGNEEGGHAWNQVKIDGNWYNADLTWDYRNLRKGEKLKYCLKSDEEFAVEHKSIPFSFPEQCNVSYPEDIIQETLLETRTELDEYRENFGKGYPKLISLSDYKVVAENTIIEPQISGDINRLVNERGDRENQR